MKTKLVKIAGCVTSVRMESEFWDALKLIADRAGKSVDDIIQAVDLSIKRTDGKQNRTSAVRVYILSQLLQYLLPTRKSL